MSENKASREDAMARRNIEEIAAVVVDAALQLHRDLGPGFAGQWSIDCRIEVGRKHSPSSSQAASDLPAPDETLPRAAYQLRGTTPERWPPACGQQTHQLRVFASSRLRVHQQNEAQS